MNTTEKIAAVQAKVTTGKVYRVPVENLGDLHHRIEKLNKRAAKLEMTPVTVEEIEREEIVKKNEIDGTTTVTNWVYLTVNGEAPTIGGFTFVASLDHTVQGDDNERVLISRTPYQRGAVSELNLDPYREAGADCDHCGYKRNRNNTYLLYNENEEKIVQVGSTCVKDFIVGANDPNRAAHMAEYLIGLDRDLGAMGEEGSGHGRITHSIRDYCANVAAVIRERGWVKRWDEYGDRRYDATADGAWENMRPPTKTSPKPIPVTEEDYAKADAAIEWARGLANRDELSEFDHNLVVVTAGNYMPEKGDGIVAYAVEGHRRHMDREKTRAAEAKAMENGEPCPAGKHQIKGTVLKAEVKFYGHDGDAREVMTVMDDRGFKVWGTVPRAISGVKAGDRVRFDATVEPKDTDPQFGFYKRPANGEAFTPKETG